MPKKTKKQKMAANQRKKVVTFEKKETKIVEKKMAEIPEKKQEKVMYTPPTIFKKELSKSLLLSAAIILVEIAIYLAQNKGISIINFQ